MSDEMRVDLGGGRERSVPVDYPSNSKYRRPPPEKPPERKRHEKIIEGKVIKRKKGFGAKFRDSLVGEGGVEGALDTFITDILVAGLKGMISDMVSRSTDSLRDGVERMLWGEPRKRSFYRAGGQYVPYDRVQRRQPAAEFRTISREERAHHDFSGLILASRGEAEEILDALRQHLEQYGTVSVQDLYDWVGITSDFTDEKWGWEDLRSASIRHVRGGYLISLPRTQPIV